MPVRQRPGGDKLGGERGSKEAGVVGSTVTPVAAPLELGKKRARGWAGTPQQAGRREAGGVQGPQPSPVALSGQGQLRHRVREPHVHGGQGLQRHRTAFLPHRKTSVRRPKEKTAHPASGHPPSTSGTGTSMRPSQRWAESSWLTSRPRRSYRYSHGGEQGGRVAPAAV